MPSTQPCTLRYRHIRFVCQMFLDRHNATSLWLSANENHAFSTMNELYDASAEWLIGAQPPVWNIRWSFKTNLAGNLFCPSNEDRRGEQSQLWTRDTEAGQNKFPAEWGNKTTTIWVAASNCCALLAFQRKHFAATWRSKQKQAAARGLGRLTNDKKRWRIIDKQSIASCEVVVNTL